MLVQAAHHLCTHPGPLGVFFRKLARKKTYNVAVVATARKMVVIAWHMLRNNEPYRYAQPRATETKLRRLRVKATGERRRPGCKPGVRVIPKAAPGVMTYTIKPLDQVYQEEGLPPLSPCSAGEARAIRKSAVSAYVKSLGKS